MSVRARAIALYLRGQIVEAWHHGVPLLLCLLGGAMWKASDTPGLSIGLIVATFIWAWALSLVWMRAEAKAKSEFGARIAAMVMDDRFVEITVTNKHTYHADEATRAAMSASADRSAA